MEDRKEDDEHGSVETLATIMNAISIEPPRLEDAGLEPCALPLESIIEAFSIAAASRCTEDDDEEDDDRGQSSGVAAEKELHEKADDEENGELVSSSSPSSSSSSV